MTHFSMDFKRRILNDISPKRNYLNNISGDRFLFLFFDQSKDEIPIHGACYDKQLNEKAKSSNRLMLFEKWFFIAF